MIQGSNDSTYLEYDSFCHCTNAAPGRCDNTPFKDKIFQYISDGNIVPIRTRSANPNNNSCSAHSMLLLQIQNQWVFFEPVFQILHNLGLYNSLHLSLPY